MTGLIELRSPQHYATSPSQCDGDAAISRQTRTKKLFSFPQIFSFSFMYFVTWIIVGVYLYFGLLNGGVLGLIVNYLIVFVGVLAQAACFAELASILPIAGAQYFWIYKFSSEKYRRFLTWTQGYATWLGYVFTLATVLNSNTLIIQGVIQINYPNFKIEGWTTLVIVLATLACYTIMNVWFFDFVPWLELIAGIVNVVSFIVTVTALLTLSPRNDPQFFLTTSSNSGYVSSFLSWEVGMLACMWLFMGFEGVIHMAEETKDPERTIPKAMVASIGFNGLLGLGMLFILILCMPPIEDMLAAPSPFIYLIVTATRNLPLSTAIGSSIALVLICAGMTMFSSASRLTWAWARDRGLPSYFGHVDSTTKIPRRAVLLTSFIVGVMSLLNLHPEAYIALGAITSLSTLSIYFSYALVLAVVLHRRLKGDFTLGEWNLGRWGLLLNIFALSYTIYTMIWLPFPTTLPVTAQTMNYSGPVFVGAGMIVTGLWFGWAKKTGVLQIRNSSFPS
ncbi:amino acid/polyamine transporter I [Microdochium trichocladiopsis]|uniref:Amino acid/polyamine transporter I n=1 Tax=Microdochium trichocladiopsis TaxID=1682393 RepID=A0A9P8XSZ4_9PEZI|nr:amino acid/polyamine transporter I [Microdochium trichocladiopsis]KAH7016202.1 amino acid/polyamine transporter I [Microdochium trichocladiopsis]